MNLRGFAFTFVRSGDCTMNAEYPRCRSHAESQRPLVCVLSLPRTQAIAIARCQDRWLTHHADEGLIYSALKFDACFSIVEGDEGQAIAPGVRTSSFLTAYLVVRNVNFAHIIGLRLLFNYFFGIYQAAKRSVMLTLPALYCKVDYLLLIAPVYVHIT